MSSPSKDDPDSESEQEMTEEEIAAAAAQRSEKSNRAQLSEMLERMTPQEIFNLYDKDGSGGIDYEEFTEMLPQIGIKMGEAKALKFSDGTMKVDLTTASTLIQVLDKVKPDNKSKLTRMINGKKGQFSAAANAVFKMVK